MLSVAEPWLIKNFHPTVIIPAYTKALEDAKAHLAKMSFVLGDNRDLLQLVKSSVGTKFISRWGDGLCQIAIDAVKTVCIDKGAKKEIDIKRYVRVEKVNYFY